MEIHKYENQIRKKASYWGVKEGPFNYWRWKEGVRDYNNYYIRDINKYAYCWPSTLPGRSNIQLAYHPPKTI